MKPIGLTNSDIIRVVRVVRPIGLTNSDMINLALELDICLISGHMGGVGKDE